MRCRILSLMTLCTLTAVLQGCPEDPEPVCVPGKSEACAGAGGCSGAQVCNAEGSGFEACVCGQAAVDSGTPSEDAGTTDAGAQDGGSMDGGTDGGSGCDPAAAPGAQGCGAGEKCSWVVISDSPMDVGQIACVPQGTAGLGDACARGVPGETTGFDDCVAGAICVNSRCQDICSFIGADTGCGADAVCTRYAGLFANGDDEPIAGACVASCNPVTQAVGDGGTCGMGQGCYLLTSAIQTVAVCAGAGTIPHNAEITGTAFANSCLPGHQPRRRDTMSTTIECGALCAPADVTSSTNVSDEGGVAPFDCVTRSGSLAAPPEHATAGESCRYWWAREPFDGPGTFSNTVGWCFKHPAFLYDSNGDMTPDAPFPRCVNLTTGDVVPPVMNPPGNDALEFWCIAVPSGRDLVASPGKPALRQIALDRLGGWRN